MTGKLSSESLLSNEERKLKVGRGEILVVRLAQACI